MIVGFAYNLKRDLPESLRTTVDAAAEYESEATVDRIRHALEANGWKVVDFPFGPSMLQRFQDVKVDIVFNIAEGWAGRTRESTVPQVLEFLGIPYTGSDPLTLGVCLDKALTKQVAAYSGIPTARFAKIEKPSELSQLTLSFPVFVKPAFEGSSKGIRSSCRVKRLSDLYATVVDLLDSYKQPVLVEEFLPGREFTVGILGNDPIKVLPPIEVRNLQIADTSEFVYCYDTKVNNKETLLCPAPITPELGGRISDLARHVASVFELKDLSRIDFRLDALGEVNLLEINPLPGLSEVSLYPLCARAAGIDFDRLVGEIVRAGMVRWGLMD